MPNCNPLIQNHPEDTANNIVSVLSSWRILLACSPATNYDRMILMGAGDTFKPCALLRK